MNNDPLHPTRVTVKAPLSSKGRRAGETEEELLVELVEEAERDRAKRVGVVHTQMPCHPSGRLAERLGATGGGGGGVGSAPECPVDCNDATSERNGGREGFQFKALTHKDKNPLEEKKELI